MAKQHDHGDGEARDAATSESSASDGSHDASGGTPVESDLRARLAAAESELAALRERHDFLVRHQMEFIVELDPEGRIRYASPSYRALFGLEETDVVGRRLGEMLVAEGAEGESLDALASLQEPPHNAYLQHRVRTRHGWRWLEWFGTGELDETGAIASIVGVGRDISALKSAEERLRGSERDVDESRRYLRTLIDHLPLAVFAKEPATGRFVLWNRASERLFGISAQEALGHTDYDFFATEEADRFHAADQALLAGEAIEAQIEEEVNTATLGRRALATTKTLIRDAAGGAVAILVVCQDVTDRKGLESELRQREKMESVGQLAGGIAHDFNNQLVSIRGFAQVLAAELEDGVQRRYAETILRTANRAADLTKKLLAFARKGKVEFQPVDLHALIDEVRTLLGSGAHPRLRIEVDPAAPSAVVQGDPGQLQNALLNLGLNARDAMPEGGVLRFATATAAPAKAERARLGLAAEPESFLVVTVRDTGHGMPPTVRERIFEPFFTTKKAGEGTGMGLASVYGTVRAHNGAVVVESEEGVGTTFRVYLPLAALAPLPTPEEEPTRLLPSGRGRVLLVEDDADAAELTRLVLERQGYGVEEARDGDAAVARCREAGPFAAVLMDLMVPGCSGRALFEALRSAQPGLPILLVSGYNLDEEAKAILDDGAAGFIQKPFDTNALIQAVATATEVD